MDTILQALKAIDGIKTVGSIQLLSQLTDQQHLQTHQYPAAIVLPLGKTAEPNAFIGGHHQRVTVNLDILLFESLPQSTRDNLISIKTLTDIVITAIAGLTDADGSAWEFVSAGIDLSAGLNVQSQLTRINFSHTNHIFLRNENG